MPAAAVASDVVSCALKVDLVGFAPPAALSPASSHTRRLILSLSVAVISTNRNNNKKRCERCTQLFYKETWKYIRKSPRKERTVAHGGERATCAINSRVYSRPFAKSKVIGVWKRREECLSLSAEFTYYLKFLRNIGDGWHRSEQSSVSCVYLVPFEENGGVVITGCHPRDPTPSPTPSLIMNLYPWSRLKWTHHRQIALWLQPDERDGNGALDLCNLLSVRQHRRGRPPDKKTWFKWLISNCGREGRSTRWSAFFGDRMGGLIHFGKMSVVDMPIGPPQSSHIALKGGLTERVLFVLAFWEQFQWGLFEVSGSQTCQGGAPLWQWKTNYAPSFSLTLFLHLNSKHIQFNFNNMFNLY